MAGPSDSMKMFDQLKVALNCAFCGQPAKDGHFCVGLYEASFKEKGSDEKDKSSEVSAVGRDSSEG